MRKITEGRGGGRKVEAYERGRQEGDEREANGEEIVQEEREERRGGEEEGGEVTR